MPFDDATREALSLSFVARLPPALRARLEALAVPMELSGDATLYRRGAEPRVGIVVEGLLRIFLTSADGREVTVRYARPGDALGLPMLVGGPVDAGGAAVGRARVLFFPVEPLRQLAREHVELAWAVAEEINGNLRGVLEELASQSFGTVRQRVARHLLDLAHGDHRGRLIAKVTQAELADAVGTVREVIARTLAQLRREGVVATGAGVVTLLDARRLDEVSRSGL